MSTWQWTRRNLLTTGLALGANAALSPLRGVAHARKPTPGKLTDIDHIVIMIQENRSFDHYFGRFPGVRGFGERGARATLSQPDGQGHVVRPFHIDANTTDGGCTRDPDHLWKSQHDGTLTPGSWVTSRLAYQPADAAVTMGYFDQRDIPYFWALAKGFTICDRYFCSALGPTDPNRSYSMTGTIDPEGAAGGPLIFGVVTHPTWTTMPEQLEARGVSWKVYGDPSATFADGDNILAYFPPYQPGQPLRAKGIDPTFENFFTDLADGNLPQVSWLLAPVDQLEHPAQSTPRRGEYAVKRVVDALTAKTDVWLRSALFVTYDENGGYFDHVIPPTPPPGTPGEYITVNPLPGTAMGVAGPVGLGARVPMIVVSPFSRGGFVSSDVFDHTSLLRFIETRFGAEVPNLSAWRRATCGDLTSAFNFKAPDARVPHLPDVAAPTESGLCQSPLDAYPLDGKLPKQFRGRARRPSGIV